MEKCIIILTGINEGKTSFINKIKEHGYWTWNVNHLNRLSSLTHEFGWDGNRDNNYYDFLKEFEELVNRYWEFKRVYILNLIEKFEINEKAQVLIIHNSDSDINKEIEELYTNAYKIHIDEGDKENNSVHKVLNCESVTFVDDILSTMKTLTKDFVQVEEVED